MPNDRVLKEEYIINSIGQADYKTIQSEKRKTAKLKFANNLAMFFLIAYLVLLMVYTLLPLFDYCSVPSTLSVFEKIGTTLIALIFGFYFGSRWE